MADTISTSPPPLSNALAAARLLVDTALDQITDARQMTKLALLIQSPNLEMEPAVSPVSVVETSEPRKLRQFYHKGHNMWRRPVDSVLEKNLYMTPEEVFEALRAEQNPVLLRDDAKSLFQVRRQLSKNSQVYGHRKEDGTYYLKRRQP